jgi:hypothetical protein
MNLRDLKFEYLDHNSLIWEAFGEKRQNVQKYTIFRGIKIYVRYENYLAGGEWKTRKVSYSLDKKVWTDSLTDIQAVIKKMGK